MTFGLLRRARRVLAAVVVAPLLLTACDIAPEPVHIGAEECAHCSMLISDRRYAGQVLNNRGRAFKFDAVECVRDFLNAGTVAAADVHSVWVTDAAAGDGWIRAEDAIFVQSPALRTPMGGGLAAYADRAAAGAVLQDLGSGELLSWAAVLAGAPATGGADAHGGHDGHGS
jgi:copper chaperone NosL